MRPRRHLRPFQIEPSKRGPHRLPPSDRTQPLWQDSRELHQRRHSQGLLPRPALLPSTPRHRCACGHHHQERPRLPLIKETPHPRIPPTPNRLSLVISTTTPYLSTSLRLSAFAPPPWCARQRTTSAVTYMFHTLGYDCTNYIDDFGGAESPPFALNAFHSLEDLFSHSVCSPRPTKTVRPPPPWHSSESLSTRKPWRCLSPPSASTSFSSTEANSLRNHLVWPKDPVPPGRRDGVVYRIPCGECDAVYIRETGRPVQERMKEHERDVRLARCQTSAVADRANATRHGPKWNDVKCIDRDPHWHTRRVKQAIQIRLHPNNINRDNGIEIPEAWMPTIRKHSWEHSDVGTANLRATRSPNHDPAGALLAARHPVYIRLMKTSSL